MILLSFCRLSYTQINPGQVVNNQSICYGSAPLAVSFTTLPDGGTAPYTYRWQRSNDGGTTWNDITGISASRTTYSPPVLGRTAMFRCRVSDSSQSPQSGVTNHLTIHVTTDLSAGVIGSAQMIYAGTAPALLTESTPPSGGSGSYSYQWQSSPVPFKTGQNGIISVTTTIENYYFLRSPDFVPLVSNDFIRYIQGGNTSNLGIPPREEPEHATFRDIVFVPFSPGIAGLSQIIRSR